MYEQGASAPVGYGNIGALNGGMQSARAVDYDTPTTTQAPGSLGSAAAETQKLLHMLHEEISGLDQRLSPVLRPTPPEANGGGKAAPSGSQLAELLTRFNAELTGAVQRIRSIHNRVDL